MSLYTPIQRAARLVMGRDLEALEQICANQESVTTRKVQRHLDVLREKLLDHGIEMRRLFDESKK